jgi:hypothetical protein
MARFIPNAEIHEPYNELAMRYLAVETERDALRCGGRGSNHEVNNTPLCRHAVT